MVTQSTTREVCQPRPADLVHTPDWDAAACERLLCAFLFVGAHALDMLYVVFVAGGVSVVAVFAFVVVGPRIVAPCLFSVDQAAAWRVLLFCFTRLSLAPWTWSARSLCRPWRASVHRERVGGEARRVYRVAALQQSPPGLPCALGLHMVRVLFFMSSEGAQHTLRGRTQESRAENI